MTSQIVCNMTLMCKTICKTTDVCISTLGSVFTNFSKNTVPDLIAFLSSFYERLQKYFFFVELQISVIP